MSPHTPLHPRNTRTTTQDTPTLVSQHRVDRARQAKRQPHAGFRLQWSKLIQPPKLATPAWNFWRVVAIIALVLFGVFIYRLSHIFPTNPQPTQPTTQKTDMSRPGTLTKGTPEFKTILPAGKKIDQLGGWTRVSPPDRDPVFAYADKIGNIPVIVSQQVLPQDFDNDTASQMSQLASNYYANRSVQAGDTKVYLGTSAKGPQSAIFTKSHLLILIKAQASVPDDAWKSYVQSLN